MSGWGPHRLPAAPPPQAGPPPPPALPRPGRAWGGRIGHLEFGPGVRAAAPAAAAAAAACWSPLVSNSLHGYSLYGGGGGGGSRSSSRSRRPPASLARLPACPPAAMGRGVVTGNGYQAPRPTPQRPAHARLQRARGGRGVRSSGTPLAVHGACQEGRSLERMRASLDQLPRRGAGLGRRRARLGGLASGKRAWPPGGWRCSGKAKFR